MTDYNKSIYYAFYNQIKLKPLVYQGLINKIPDLDSVFLLTSGKMKENLNITFSKNLPLLYLPDNYVPINSKNTKYLYEIFPFLMLPVTLNESIADIIRGYILERFVFGYEGVIAFHNNGIYKDNFTYNNPKFPEERELLFKLDKILEIIKANKSYSTENPKKLLFQILSELIKNNFLNDKDKFMYKAFFHDLSNIGFHFSNKFYSEIKSNYKEYLNLSSEFIYYIPTNQNILKGNNQLKMMKHSSSDIIYDDILLIINFNHPGYLNLSDYLEELYKKYFPNIVYLYPVESQNEKYPPNIVICTDSTFGFYSYVCFETIYERYPNYKGYFLINDDVYMKAWEIQNYDLTIPWFYIFSPGGINSNWLNTPMCVHLYNMCDINLDWKRNMTNFFGVYKIFFGLSDLYYIPQYYINSFIQLAKEMFNSKIFLECAVHAIFAIILAPKYHAIYLRALWGDERNQSINVLHDEFQQISIHPIKFSKEDQKNSVRKYNFFINANDF